MSGHFGIVVSGGPAPGINSVISASVIEAVNRGHRVFGFIDGFEGVCTGGATKLTELTVAAVSRIALQGGSILGTSRFNPCEHPMHLETLRAAMDRHSIDKLVVIGGEGSAYLSHLLSTRVGSLDVVHVPKTIDNDLPLPHHHPSFGFETARHAGMRILDTLSIDAQATKRWYLVTCMGRKAGFLALGLGLASGAPLTIIPEEFEGTPTTPRAIAELISATVTKRVAMDRRHGVVLIAEGVIDHLDPASSPLLAAAPRDHLNRINYSEIELADLIIPELRAISKSTPANVKWIAKNIGYELRCHAPIAFDVEYTRFLGYGAVEILDSGGTDCMVVKNYDQLDSVPLGDLVGPDGRIEGTRVDLSSDLYRVARHFMIR